MKVRVKNELEAGQRLAAPKVRKVWSGDQEERACGEGICTRSGGCEWKFLGTSAIDICLRNQK